MNKKYGWAKASAGVETPMIKSAFIDPELGTMFHDTGLTSEGQFLVSSHLSDLRKVNRFKQFNIDARSITEELNKALREGYSRDYEELIKKYYEALQKQEIKN